MQIDQNGFRVLKMIFYNAVAWQVTRRKWKKKMLILWRTIVPYRCNWLLLSHTCCLNEDINTLKYLTPLMLDRKTSMICSILWQMENLYCFVILCLILMILVSSHFVPLLSRSPSHHVDWCPSTRITCIPNLGHERQPTEPWIYNIKRNPAPCDAETFVGWLALRKLRSFDHF